jgi:hypothetical protein
MAEVDRPREEILQEMYERKVEPRLRTEMYDLEYKNLSQGLNIIMSFEGKPIFEDGMTMEEKIVRGEEFDAKNKAEIIEKLKKMGKEIKPEDNILGLLRVDLTPTEVWSLVPEEKITTFTWNKPEEVEVSERPNIL